MLEMECGLLQVDSLLVVYSLRSSLVCEPNLDVDADAGGFQGPKTEIEKVLCLCLMSFHSHFRDQAWRNTARAQLPIWKTSFDHTRSQIPTKELRQKPRTQTTIPLYIPAVKRLRPCTSRLDLRLNLPSPRAVECPPDPWLVVHLPMSSTGRILRTRMQILLLPRDGSGVSARSHLLPPLNDRHQQPNQILRELEAVNLIHMTINFARSSVS